MAREETAVVGRNLRETPAYRSGWEDGRFGLSGSLPTSEESAGDDGLERDLERRAYYHGHREGQRIRQMLRGEEELG